MRLLEGETPPLQNEDGFLSSSYLKGTLHHYKMKIGFIIYMFYTCFYHQVTWREHLNTTKYFVNMF